MEIYTTICICWFVMGDIHFAYVDLSWEIYILHMLVCLGRYTFCICWFLMGDIHMHICWFVMRDIHMCICWLVMGIYTCVYVDLTLQIQPFQQCHIFVDLTVYIVVCVFTYWTFVIMTRTAYVLVTCCTTDGYCWFRSTWSIKLFPSSRSW